jgi:SIR2-like domain
LARFDVIFTLNQDLLLELHHKENPLLPRPVRLPGMRPVPDIAIRGIGDKHLRRWTPSGERTIEPNAQPLIKIHGSSNWQTKDGARLLVIGGNKDFMIREHDVLLWYFELFKQYLDRGDARLMVIGYGFGDEHINDVIRQAGRAGKLKGMFLVDPAGRAILNRTNHLPIRVHDDLEDVVSLGGSTRPLSRIFGGDAIGFQELDGFFNAR